MHLDCAVLNLRHPDLQSSGFKLIEKLFLCVIHKFMINYLVFSLETFAHMFRNDDKNIKLTF